MIYTFDDRRPEIATDAWVAPNATVIGDVRIDSEASVWFGAVLRGDVERLSIGRGTNIQDNAVLHSDPGAPLTLGAQITVGHLVMLHGCEIGDGSLIGIGAIVMNHARIGRHCIVGASAMVTEGKEFPDGSLILGSPAKLARPLTAEEIARLSWSAQRYIERAKRYRERLQAGAP
jgi:carbonic anhydrase/acetyltransferase-like protein (isoleucine patch superfamily)